jgi:hypothetical protein
MAVNQEGTGSLMVLARQVETTVSASRSFLFDRIIIE